MNILVLGICPSKNMKPGDLPFHNTRSGKKLKEWMSFLNVDSYSTRNVLDVYTSTPSKKLTLVQASDLVLKVSSFDVVIVLGKASKRHYNKWCSELEQVVFYLPHPSGLNRELNDLIRVEANLLCVKFLIGAKRIHETS